MFDPILVPLDGSLLAECVLPHAVAFAQAFNARIILLRVLERNQPNGTTQIFDLLNWQIKKTEAKLYLEKITARLSKSHLQITATVLEGLVAETITEFAENHGTKLIILSSHGRSGLSQWGISSVTQKVIFSAPTSVLIIRAHQLSTKEVMEQPYKQILIPLDGSRRAENVLPITTQIARYHHAQIHIVHVVKKPEMARHMPLTSEDVDLSDRIVGRNREVAIRYLDKLQSRSPLDGIKLQTHLLTSDNAMAAIHGLVEQEQIEMVALSAHGYSGNSQWPYGSLVNNFILYSTVPLLIVQDLPAKEEISTIHRPTRENPEQ